MNEYILRRLLFAVPVVFLVALIIFLITNAMPGDVIDSIVAGSGLKPAEVEAYKHDMGLDKPVYERFFSWLGGIFQGDFGKAYFTGTSVRDELVKRIPPTLELGILAIILAMLIAIPMGIISAIRPNTAIDYVARFVATFGLSVPEFVVGVLFLLLASKYFGFFPGAGFVLPWENPVANMKQVWMPVLILGFRQSASTSRILRSTLLEVLHSDYIRTAWAKGLRERAVVTRHALKNAFIPVITLIGIQARSIMGGVVIIEVLFNIPGIGRLLVESVLTRDLIPLQSIVLILAVAVVLLNLLVDISYSWFDPRIRQGR